jgi:hypothetical protein
MIEVDEKYRGEVPNGVRLLVTAPAPKAGEPWPRLYFRKSRDLLPNAWKCVPFVGAVSDGSARKGNEWVFAKAVKGNG